MGTQCSQSVYNIIHLHSYDPHEHSLLPTTGNQSLGSNGSVPVQHSTCTHGEIQETTVLSTLLLHRPLYGNKKEHRSSTFSIVSAFYVLFLRELSNHKTTSDRQECRISWLQQISLQVIILIATD